MINSGDVGRNGQQTMNTHEHKLHTAVLVILDDLMLTPSLDDLPIEGANISTRHIKYSEIVPTYKAEWN